MNEGERLVLLFIPSLVSVLARREREKGAPLLYDEVISIRDSAMAVMVPEAVVPKVTESRGYHDINFETCWGEWQSLREELAEDGA